MQRPVRASDTIRTLSFDKRKKNYGKLLLFVPK
jgi:hypothetical protein